MTDYSELVIDLRDADTAMMNWKRLSLDAAAAIEALQAEMKFYKNLAEERQETADRKERLLCMYRAQNTYSAKDASGNVITNLCSSNRSETPNN